MIIYLFHVWPMETRFATKMEVFNECTLILLAYGLLMFTDFVDDAKMRFQIGYAYLGVNIANLSVHLTILMVGTVLQIRQACRRRIYNKKVEDGKRRREKIDKARAETLSRLA